MNERIALVLPNLGGGGAERVAITLAEELIARGHQVDFVLASGVGALLHSVPASARVVDLGASRLIRTVGPLTRYLRRARPAATLVFMWPLTSLAVVARSLARSNTRLVVSDHNTESVAYAGRGRVHRLILKRSMTLYRLADARVAVSEGVADDSAQLSGIDRRRFTVIPNPVPAAFGTPVVDDGAQIWGVPRGRRILHIGSFKAQKDHDLLLRAYALLDRGANDRLLLLGDGPLRSRLTSLAATLGIAEQVLMPGFTTDTDQYLATADLFVLSSRHEGFGLVLVEALAHGLPVVSTDCPSGPAEILRDGAYGRLVPVGDSGALSAAMAAALRTPDDPELRAARIRRAADFAPGPIAEAYLDLLLPGR